MTVKNQEEADADAGSLAEIGKALDPFFKRMPKKAVGGGAGAAAIAALHGIIPPDFTKLQHNVLDWSIVGGMSICIGIVVWGSSSRK